MRATVGILGAVSLTLLGTLTPRPAAAGGTGDTKNLDELVASVEGEFITRRTLMREVGARNPEEDERIYEIRLRKVLYARAIRRIFVHAGEQIGLSMTPDMLEEQVQWRIDRIVESARAQAEKDKPGSGQKITIERILKENSQSMEEFRAEVEKEVMRERYFWVLQRGVPGKRAVVDVEPSPEDLRRLYAAHRGDLAVKRAVRFAFWKFSPIDFLDEGRRTYDEAGAEARRRADLALVEFARDRDAARVAQVCGAKPKEWLVKRPGDWVEDLGAKASGDKLGDWLFDKGRRAGDSIVIDDPQGSLYAVALVEVRGTQPLSFDEVKEALAKRVRDVRTVRFRTQHLLGLLGRAQVWPASLAEELEDQQRVGLAKLDEDPVNRDIRLP